MNRTNRIVLAVAVLALGGTSTFAQTVTPQPTAKTVPQSQASMAQAIQVAEKHTGARARKAEMERDRGVDAYEIKTVAKDKSTKVYVDVASGKVLRVDRPGMLDWIANLFDDDRREDQAALARLEASPMNLAAAISAAEREIGGRAVKASLRTQHGQPAFEVRMVKDLVKHKVLVDPASGKVVTIAQGKDDD
jgi:uncharacterized membrane protein YkoI